MGKTAHLPRILVNYNYPMIRRDVIKAWFTPKTLVMLGLGFGSGLPFLLTANTFAFWLRDSGTTLTAIGLLSWVQWTYPLKMFWAPLVDRLPAPILARLGRRRGWIALSQLWLMLGLMCMAIARTGNLVLIGALALIVAFGAATQDIVVDAWRIEIADDSRELGLLASAYQLGYRTALLITDSFVLILANHFGWSIAYGLCAGAMVVALVAMIYADEPLRADEAMQNMERVKPLSSWRGMADAVIGPFRAFFRTYGWISLIMLAMISLYRLPDFVMGMMYNPFYHDLGLSKDAVGITRGTIGLPMSLLGIAAGGASALRFGIFRTLIFALIAQSLATASFAVLAVTDPDPLAFSLVMAGDSFSLAYAGVALVTYLSGLTSLGYTATQYALLSSVYAYLGKFLKGFAGIYVEALSAHVGLLSAYAIAFVTAAALGIPPLLLCFVLMRKDRHP